MILSNESPKTWTALLLLGVGALLGLLVRACVAPDSPVHPFASGVAAIPILISIWFLCGGFTSLNRTPKQISNAVRSGREPRKTVLQWICMLLALLLLVFVV